MKIGYLGPEGTNTQQAALVLAENAELLDFVTIEDLFEAVENATVDGCVVPFENSTEGMVNITADSLICSNNLFIQNEMFIPINHCLMVKKADADVCKVLSHNQALSQCRGSLRKYYPDVEIVSASSTAEAAKIVSQSMEQGLGAICNPLAAVIYDLQIVKEYMQDKNNNMTRFILISRDDNITPLAGRKMTIAFSTENEPGALSKILNIFSIWGINMTSIASRPSKNKMGEYIFLSDVDIPIDEGDMKHAITMIKRKTCFFKNFGCYDKGFSGLC